MCQLSRHLGTACCLLFLAAGCFFPPAPPKPDEVVRVDTNPDFAGLREDLVDIAVLAARPPEGDPHRDGPYLRRFRRLVYEGLLQKGYSPLKLHYVDQNLAGETLEKRTDPDYNVSRFDEDAIMVLSTNEWSKRWKREDDVIMVSAALSLIRSSTREKLWMHEIRHRFYKIPRPARELGLSEDEAVMDLVVKDLLKDLPPRA